MARVGWSAPTCSGLYSFGHGSKPMGFHFEIGAPILGPILVVGLVVRWGYDLDLTHGHFTS